jgi:CheY-like chemotaxis protein
MKKHTIMIVEDDPFITEVIRINLACSEYALVQAENGKAALEKLAHIKPDLMIVDIMMPVMDGWQLLESIRTDPSLSQMKVLIESALLITPKMLEQKHLSPKTKVLLKPFSLVELKAIVKKLLKESLE